MFSPFEVQIIPDHAWFYKDIDPAGQRRWWQDVLMIEWMCSDHLLHECRWPARWAQELTSGPSSPPGARYSLDTSFAGEVTTVKNSTIGFPEHEHQHRISMLNVLGKDKYEAYSNDELMGYHFVGDDL